MYVIDKTVFILCVITLAALVIMKVTSLIDYFIICPKDRRLAKKFGMPEKSFNEEKRIRMLTRAINIFENAKSKSPLSPVMMKLEEYIIKSLNDPSDANIEKTRILHLLILFKVSDDIILNKFDEVSLP